MFVPILEYENYYAVNEVGEILNLKTNKILKQSYLKGYKRVSFKRGLNGKKRYMPLVHRLVAEAFIPNPKGKAEVNHINCKRDDNSIGNLEWATREENNQHAWDFGSKIFKMTEKHISQQIKKDK